MTIWKLFTGAYCATCEIGTWKLSGYGNSHSEALGELFRRIDYMQKIQLI